LWQIGERKVKQRTLGNIRLISHLYKSEVVNEKILHYCIQDMLGDGKSDPVEDNVEVMGPLSYSMLTRRLYILAGSVCGVIQAVSLPAQCG
jgi:hypothetical protein